MKIEIDQGSGFCFGVTRAIGKSSIMARNATGFSNLGLLQLIMSNFATSMMPRCCSVLTVNRLQLMLSQMTNAST